MKVRAKFIKSLSSVEDYENKGLEVVFLGRSNVGKSSLINSLCANKNLAKSSSTPGKTQLINIFEVEFIKDELKKNFTFIDMPGFGYARVSKSLKRLWNKNLDEFLRKKKSIKLFIHLIDSRHTALEIDEEIRKYLYSILSKEQILLTVFTKADKLNQSQRFKLNQDFAQSLLVSNLKKTGLEKLEEIIFNLG